MSDHLRRAQDEIPDRETPDPADLVIDIPSRATRAAVLIDPADFNVPEPSPYNGDDPFDF